MVKLLGGDHGEAEADVDGADAGGVVAAIGGPQVDGVAAVAAAADDPVPAGTGASQPHNLGDGCTPRPTR